MSVLETFRPRDVVARGPVSASDQPGNSAPPDNLVCIVIPVHRGWLTKAEHAALSRCAEVLHRYPMVICTPESLDVGDILAGHPGIGRESFEDAAFKSIDSYNKLLLTDAFYARFAGYRYILIHQLDAFVFTDQLRDWCERGYDYVGAPWLLSNDEPTLSRQARAWAWRGLSRVLATRPADERRHGRSFWRQLRYTVGNGGLSLRRVAKMREVLASLANQAEVYRRATPGGDNGRPLDRWAEDVFFSLEANRYFPRVKAPGLKEAAGFAWEDYLHAAAYLTDGALPFGCHAWDRMHADHWRPVFRGLGYDLDAILGD